MFSLSFKALTFEINPNKIELLKKSVISISRLRVTIILCIILGIISTIISFQHGWIIAYGDAESHLNIAKRVVSGLTPGFAQLGGIWLPLPHIMLIPFVYFDYLWRTGLAGSIVSGICFLTSAITLYKFTYYITKNQLTSFIASLIFIFNPNILYMQTTPMTELPLIMFFLLSTYFFVKYLYNLHSLTSIIFAAFFTFCAVLTRYDGWMLVIVEILILFSQYLLKQSSWKKTERLIVLFGTLSLFGIFLWLMWDYLILGNPLYFNSSQYSAQAQQQAWLLRNELPGYKNIVISFLYYLVTSMVNSGEIISIIAFLGLGYFLLVKKTIQKLFTAIILFTPFYFYVVSLFLGEAVIFIPQLTPISYEWRLFNVRYGIMMVPVFAFFFAYLFQIAKPLNKFLIIALFIIQCVLYPLGISKIITLDDGVNGLSTEKNTQVQQWMLKHYDKGLVLLDDYARTMGVIKSGIPMQNVIYVGTKPYWQESLEHPEKYAKWIVMQNNDDVWKGIYDNKQRRAELYKYFNEVYDSKAILVFERK